MPKYEVTAESYIDGRIVKVGEHIEFDGVPHDSNLRAVDKLAEKAVAAVKATPPSVAEIVAQARQHASTRGADPVTQTNAEDVAAVLKGMESRPDDATIKQAVAVISGDASA